MTKTFYYGGNYMVFVIENKLNSVHMNGIKYKITLYLYLNIL